MLSKCVQMTPQVCHYISQHHSGASDELLGELQARTAELGDQAEMQIAPEQGTLLTILTAACNAKNAIEIGTFTGYSALCIARGLAPDGHLFCCDISEEWTSIAREYWRRAGVEERITLKLGPAAETLRNLLSETVFDFAFIDADKTGYDEYLELLLPRMRPNALLVFDNMLREGRVAGDVETMSEAESALHALNEKLASDARVQSVLLPVADGLQVCRVLAS